MPDDRKSAAGTALSKQSRAKAKWVDPVVRGFDAGALAKSSTQAGADLGIYS
ncbi:MAG: hypothetical protein JWO81_590 [Alphaproteobacteria bacterium]|nr:hypothetical protein [Alphaproteobacteria bacterium]